MHYPNALSGIRALRTAKLISVWLIVITVVMLVAAAVGREASVGIIAILGLIVLVLGIVGLVMELVGVSRAAKDHSIFRSARTAIIIEIICSVISAFLDSKSFPAKLLDLVESVCSLCATILIVKGIIALAESLHRGDMADRGQKLIRIILTVVILGLILNFLETILPENLGTAIFLLIIALVSLVLSLVELVLFLRYLKDAVAMLSMGDPTAPMSGGGSPGSPSRSSWGYDMN